jgi:GTP pyrophosphokinase
MNDRARGPRYTCLSDDDRTRRADDPFPRQARACGRGRRDAARHRRAGAQVDQDHPGHYPQADLSRVERAFDFAVEAHAGQTRASGEAFVTHPIASAQILADLGIDPVAAVAALLHDVPEDTDFSLADIEDRFGPDAARLVDGVTKLSRLSTHTHEEQQAENIRKDVPGAAEDVRVVLIKLADRLHNMRTLGALPAKRQRIARQTAEIYAPLAERLGIWQIKWLEDLAFKELEGEAYKRLAAQLETRRKAREAYVQQVQGILADALKAAGIEAELSGRPKHINSIWKKMQRKGADLNEIYDVYALRVLVDELKDCYAALGVVHSLWRPIPGQFDDYIAMPKGNLYQSLHTAVIALDGKPLEVQIRTHAMHRVSEVGIADHWRYKDGPSGKGDRDYDAKLAWVRQLMDWQREISDATEFVEGLKLDIFQDQVFVFTPKGAVKDLPAGATPLDFAYRIHTDVGHRTIGAKINNRLVPLDYRLKTGDIVEIVTTKGAHGPSRDWLKIVRTSHAREKIRHGSSARSATRTSSTGARTSIASCVAWRAPRSSASAPRRSARWPRPTSSARSTTSTPPSATAPSALSRSSCASASPTTPTRPFCPRWRRPPLPAPAGCASRVSATARALRQVLPPTPGD